MTSLDEVEALLSSARAEAAFRTVVSRAYYVTFRRLVGVTTPLGFNQAERPPDTTRRFPSVHARLNDFMRRSPEPTLASIARMRIRELFDLRIRADYRFGMPMNKATAEEAVLISRDIFDWLEQAGL